MNARARLFYLEMGMEVWKEKGNPLILQPKSIRTHLMGDKQAHTTEQFRQAMQACRELFSRKLQDYGAAWRILRPTSVTDQIYIKANRIRSIEQKGVALVDEGIFPEFQGIVNYGIVALIQLELGFAESEDLSPQQAIAHYDKHAGEALQLMLRKNHDYDEAWRSMRVSSYTDLILMKLQRTKQIERNGGQTQVSEGLAANYLDMINYAVFGLIKLTEGNPSPTPAAGEDRS